MSTTNDLGRTVLSVTAALLVTATSFVAVAGPARAATPTEVVVTVPATTGLVGAVRY